LEMPLDVGFQHGHASFLLRYSHSSFSGTHLVSAFFEVPRSAFSSSDRFSLFNYSLRRRMNSQTYLILVSRLSLPPLGLGLGGHPAVLIPGLFAF